MNIKDCPPIQVNVSSKYLFQDQCAQGCENGTLIGVRVQQNQAFQFTVLLESGALFTGIPISAIAGIGKQPVLSLHEAQAYDAIGDDIEVIEHQSLRLMNCSVKTYSDPERIINGIYLFTIEFRNSGLARHPEQWKQFHVISTELGLIAYPQYRIIFKDGALCPDHKRPIPKYIANKTVHVSE